LHHEHVHQHRRWRDRRRAHESVAQATSEWLALTETMLDLLAVDSDTGLPPTNYVTVRAFTYEGHRAVTAPEDDLGHGRHAASPLFLAAHRVISELRLIDEQHRSLLAFLRTHVNAADPCLGSRRRWPSRCARTDRQPEPLGLTKVAYRVRLQPRARGSVVLAHDRRARAQEPPKGDRHRSSHCPARQRNRSVVVERAVR